MFGIPDKADWKWFLWICVAGALLGLLANAANPRGFDILLAAGLK